MVSDHIFNELSNLYCCTSTDFWDLILDRYAQLKMNPNAS